ncbi:MXAN_6640 family putative metalloprotease [Pimelobacter sp. 30-1]|uniref:MXAN_6640 family putative metalloprotease n=1 Tax=Pimelobacter sp. 30-1 TaxID=2004991 RepID=UPI001C056703|nr:MXAN_6640 family putative metalloprotease [Pimelobacter sp. 30-1]MBU2694692.1 hypothetical protein [Pimelobacter sp. 30-1]
MTSRSRFPRAAFLVPSLLTALLVVPLTGAAAQAETGSPVPPTDLTGLVVDPLTGTLAPATAADPADPAAPVDPQAEAEAALETVQGIIDPATPVTTTDSNDLTLALADLATTRDDLPSGLKKDAARLLARPNPNDPAGGIECTSGSGLPCYGSVPEAPSVCENGICVHYVASGVNAASGAWAADVLDVMQYVAGRYATAGYRKPLSDGAAGMSSGGVGNVNGAFDVYLADLGKYGLYGYCTTDRQVGGHGTAPAYCVLDNDYSAAEFGRAHTPTENLQVTAAHEYFHAVQFAYDIGEERWMMEATATWAEDELYDNVNDNRQFLSSGPLGRPAQAMTNANGAYGAWIFFRYLSERFPTPAGGMPVIIRDIWNRAAGTTDARTALNRTLAARNTELRKQFGWFTAWNRRPAAYYSEGSAYRAAPLWRSYRLTMGRSVSARTDINKLASRTVRYKSALQRAGRLRVDVNLSSRNAGAFAIVTIKQKNKPAVTRKVKINAKGDKRVVYPFGRNVQWVEINLSNSGNKTRAAKISARVIR